mmetsp:Transcript_16167/g.44493  ORF Transcript_16167/g.44493 Transcript_16167/m.44493 type:complete len:246 (-) Transcript_16167:164-901(-)|eukprot:CAMPEP_0168721614 /NCGR_PEP_ID=MMETSP0724-20121128/2173_1 /TAXON_ID=265536 /ORGANISM="Amphiprora sp., Strain CCMP467" /LENGTH=245 /DNA_ID=CAMNT_0008768261 /DNA_START=37 /DNA_END=774 /DNA_ORIENTATION=+
MVRLRVCPFSVAVFFGTAAYVTYQLRKKQQDKNDHDDVDNKNNNKNSSSEQPNKVVFVLGGPGAGKGTQCQLLQERLAGWKHLSAGDLLRAQRKKGGELGDLINARIAAGALVPSDVTCQLLLNAMKEATGISKFLIDGFPRSQENLDAWNTIADSNVQVEFVLCLSCPEEVLTGRLLERGKTSGRVDDADLTVIRKRYDTFRKETQPILDYYKGKGEGTALKEIASDQSVEQVYQQIVVLFESL